VRVAPGIRALRPELQQRRWFHLDAGRPVAGGCGHCGTKDGGDPGGVVALSGGRPGIFVWVNADGTGKDWQEVDVAAHHNACCPKETIGSTTSYTEIIALDERHLLLIYDRIPGGWGGIPKDSPESNSAWVVRVEISRDE
jgi:hypothetical protein